jgi:protein-disulfide isomerase
LLASAVVVSIVAAAVYLVRTPSGGEAVQFAAGASPAESPSNPVADAGVGNPAVTGAPSVSSEQGGLTAAGNPILGLANAPVRIVAYEDYQCPNCRQFATEVLPWLKNTWISRGFVSVEYRDFAIRGEPSIRAAEAAHCAGEQGAYWTFHDALFATAPAGDEPFSRTSLDAIAAASGLDASGFGACMDDGRHRARVESSTAEAMKRGFEGTPAYDINGRVTMGAIPVDRWNELFLAYEAETGG